MTSSVNTYRVLTDIAKALIILGLLGVIFAYFDAFEFLLTFLKRHEAWELDELFLISLFSPVVLLWFAYRRWRDYMAEIRSRQQYEQALLEQMKYDTLTQLFNRASLEKELKNAMQESIVGAERLVLVLINVDRFKHITSRYPEKTADIVLKSLAKQLRISARDGDILARVGVDEFALIMKKHTSDNLHQQLENIRNNACIQVLGEGELIQINCSLGVSIYSYAEDHTISALNLLRQAELALFQCRQHEGTYYRIYNRQAQVAIKREQYIRADIERAISEGELELFFQPQLDLLSNQTVGAEALIRWNHPEKGFLTPDKFLDAIEGHPVSVRLGEWVMESALQVLSGLINLDPDLTVSVNVSPYHLQQKNYPERLEQLLQKYADVSPTSLKIEITETGKMTDYHQVRQSMAACCERGTSFSLDDFGTGFSALNQLRVLPVAQLKIDRSFVSNFLVDDNDFKMVSSIIGLAKSFGLDLVAEGIETLEQCEKLKELGCKKVQGYYFSKPIPGEAFRDWVEAEKQYN